MKVVSDSTRAAVGPFLRVLSRLRSVLAFYGHVNVFRFFVLLLRAGHFQFRFYCLCFRNVVVILRARSFLAFLVRRDGPLQGLLPWRRYAYRRFFLTLRVRYALLGFVAVHACSTFLICLRFSLRYVSLHIGVLRDRRGFVRALVLLVLFLLYPFGRDNRLFPAYLREG